MSGSVLVDSGPLVALFDGADAYQAQARAWITRSKSTRLLTNAAVLTEACYLIGSMVSAVAAADLAAWSASSMVIDRDLSDDLTRIAAIKRKYHDLPADFADASLVAMAERLSVFTVASVDQDFTIYHSSTKKRFTNVFYIHA